MSHSSHPNKLEASASFLAIAVALLCLGLLRWFISRDTVPSLPTTAVDPLKAWPSLKQAGPLGNSPLRNYQSSPPPAPPPGPQFTPTAPPKPTPTPHIV